MKPAALKLQLEAVSLSPERAEAVSQAWASAGPDLVEKLRQGIFTPKKVGLTLALSLNGRRSLEISPRSIQIET